MTIYLRRLFPHDLTHEVSVLSEICVNFFENKSVLSFRNGDDENDENNYTVTINSATDPRFGGDFKSIYSNRDPKVDDIIMIIKKGDLFYLSLIKPTDSRHSTFKDLFKTKSERHTLIYNEEDNDNSSFEELPPEDSTIIENGNRSVFLNNQDYSYMAAIRTKPFLILGGFSGTGKSIKVKELAFATCPSDGVLNVSETSPGNYLLVSVKPNWHDATDITGFRSSVNRNYYVTDFMRFLVKAKLYEDKKVPFFVCLDEMNLAPVEEYFAEFLSVIESRKRRKDGKIVTDAIVPASVFSANDYSDDFNIFMSLGLKLTNTELKADSLNEYLKTQQDVCFERQDIVDELKRDGLTIPQNVIIIGTVNMDDTTNTFSRKVIDRAMTFETIVGEFDLGYFDSDIALSYVNNPIGGNLFVSDEVRASEMLDEGRFMLNDQEKRDIISFINNINADLKDTPFKISYRILNETMLYYRSRKVIKNMVDTNGGFDNEITFGVDLNTVFDDILMQKILPRIEGDYDKCNDCLQALLKRAKEMSWKRSEVKITFMINRFGRDNSGFTSFWN